jgi:hypothetical protein
MRGQVVAPRLSARRVGATIRSRSAGGIKPEKRSAAPDEGRRPCAPDARRVTCEEYEALKRPRPKPRATIGEPAPAPSGEPAPSMQKGATIVFPARSMNGRARRRRRARGAHAAPRQKPR